MKYIYGPVKSRRLGLSLGISLLPYKLCNFDCVYCQLGPTKSMTGPKKEYFPVEEIIDELRSWLVNNADKLQGLDYVTISGAGEPTLNTNIKEAIRRIKEIGGRPVAVITNASYLHDASVRQALLEADLIVPSLDAVTQKVFERINRPEPGIKIEDIISGLIELRKEFRGKIWLEVMLAAGINDDLRQIKKMKEIIEQVRPDKVQLNSPVRTTAESGVLCVERSKLEKIKEILGEKAEII
ncbi:MAG: radical SAM protein [Candidatus Omnitrophica bacterium]|nr:radical SAM protein [Candidatus Omnitrophota bacterium]